MTTICFIRPAECETLGHPICLISGCDLCHCGAVNYSKEQTA